MASGLRPVASGRPVASTEVRTVSRKKLSAEQTYEKEVVALHRILNEKRDMLDPKTVAILETSLTMIDSAISQSRTALKNDPNSPFLREQLNNALDKKVELLRTVALLPSRS